MDTRRLDALLARHLFGLDPSYRMVTMDKDGSLWDWTRPNLPMVQMWVVFGGPGDYREVDRYSATYDGMGAVLEVMRGRGWHVSVWTDSGARQWVCDFVAPGQVKRGRADTAPLAVALAAARALCPEEMAKLDADEYILGEDVTHLARPKARDNQETSASSPVQQVDVPGGEGG